MITLPATTQCKRRGIDGFEGPWYEIECAIGKKFGIPCRQKVVSFSSLKEIEIRVEDEKQHQQEFCVFRIIFHVYNDDGFSIHKSILGFAFARCWVIYPDLQRRSLNKKINCVEKKSSSNRIFFFSPLLLSSRMCRTFLITFARLWRLQDDADWIFKMAMLWG